MRVLFFGTHPFSTNGYSYVTTHLAKYMSAQKDIKYSIYGFQNFGNVKDDHKKARQWPDNIYVYDAFANENPKQIGFGFDQAKDFVTLNRPDVVVLYNDMIVVSNLLEKLKQIPDRTFKIIVYIDQVYLHQKKEHIRRLNEEADLVLAFTPYWEENVKKLGITKPTNSLCHGFSKAVHYPIPKQLARQYYGLRNEDFIVMNLNRNQPRKRWDTCLQAFAEVVSRHIGEPIKLLIATAVQGAWNLVEIYERELNKRGLTLEEGMKHIILIDNPQQLSDEEVNILYNVADIGINTCDGEGFGLCNFQQAAIGIPQIVPFIGGFREFFNKTNALLIQPKMTFYVDSSRDGVGGEAELCDFADFADAIDLYYTDDNLRKAHGKKCREELPEQYSWEKIGKKYVDILKTFAKEEKPIVKEPSVVKLSDLEKLEEPQAVDINELKDPVTPKPVAAKAVPRDSAQSKSKLRNRLKSKLESKKQKKESSHDMSKDELLAMKKKIEDLIERI
jgi:glycosyltransferase involved in cell wall biosynthesis